MYQERILLTVKDILEKEFKIDTRGYRPQEVDKFLDIIIRDYEEMTSIIKELEKDKLILRNEYPQIPPKVEYSLTDKGRSLMQILDQLCIWGEQNKE